MFCPAVKKTIKKRGYTGRGKTQGSVVCWPDRWYSVLVYVCIIMQRVCV